MLPKRGKPFRWWMLLSGILAGYLLYTTPVEAQDADQGSQSGSRYRTGENTPADGQRQGDRRQAGDAAAKDKTSSAQKAEGPVRMARFSYVSGKVTWRADESMDWSPATVNLPIRQGAQVWVTNGGRADIQFDDGSEMRLGNGALAVLKLLYSDAEGEFTQIDLKEGLATLYARHDTSVYQIETPFVSVKTNGPSQIRFGIDSGSEVAVQRGSATVEGLQGKITLQQGDYLDLADADTRYQARPLPRADSWDGWNTERNRLIEGKSETSQHVPPNIGIVSGNLDEYGTWRNDPHYGWVWCPHVTASDWRPYYDGHWTWVDPFGWTWVSDEPWGWAPYHYGTWIHQPYGWGWVPGPVNQYWCPGVVSFSVYAGQIAWAPLCPWEVRYPAFFSLGFANRNWAFSFSIGCAGVYFPVGERFCEGRPFDNVFVNQFAFNHGDHFRSGDHVADILNHNAFLTDHHFTPFNASHAAGTSVASAEAFGGRGRYHPVARADAALFTHGQAPSAPAVGRAPVSGPPSVRPTHLAMTPTRSFTSEVHPMQTALQRSIYHASLPTAVRRDLPAMEIPRSPGATSGERARFEAVTPQNPAAGSTGRTHTTFEGRAPVDSVIPRIPDSRHTTASEAARQARASLGILGNEQGSGFPRGSGRYSGERATSPMRSSGVYGDGYTGAARSGGGNSQRYTGSVGHRDWGGERVYTPARNASGGGGTGSSSRPMYGSSSSSRPVPSRGYSGGSYGGRTGGSVGGNRTGSSGSGGGRSGGGNGRSRGYNGR
jgi:hypothetical protein